MKKNRRKFSITSKEDIEYLLSIEYGQDKMLDLKVMNWMGNGYL